MSDLKKWPELVGKDGEEAKAIIEGENPSLNVYLVPEGSGVTMDFRTDRVRIYLNAEKKVAKTPCIG